MYVSQGNGIVVVAGEITKTDFRIDRNDYMKAIYYIKTTGVDWTDPTGQKGASDVNWTISAWGFAASPAGPNFPYPKKHIIIEAIPESGETDIWRTAAGKPKKAIKLKALFTQPIEEGKERLINTVKYHPRGSMYPPWWRPDMYKDDDPNITGKYDDNHDYGLGFQDDMRDDMEFFYEDERWSRD